MRLDQNPKMLADSWDWRIHRRLLGEFTQGEARKPEVGEWYLAYGGHEARSHLTEYAEQATSEWAAGSVREILVWKFIPVCTPLSYYESGYYDGLTGIEIHPNERKSVHGYPSLLEGTPKGDEYQMGLIDGQGERSGTG